MAAASAGTAAVVGALGSSSMEESTILIGCKEYPHPATITSWVDDTKLWPEIGEPHIICYLLETKACDLKEAKAYKSLESYNYLQSGWVGQVLAHKIDDVIFLKAPVRPSQAVNQKPRAAWVCAKQSGEVMTAGCTCMAGEARVCSHAGAIMWKVNMAVKLSFTGQSCTDGAASWNSGTKRNVEPVMMTQVNFKMQKCAVDADIPPPRRQPLLQFTTDKELQEYHDKSPYSHLFNIPGTLLHHTLTATCSEEPAIARPLADIGHQDHSNAALLPDGCHPCYKFYQDFVVLSETGVGALEEATRNQASSPLWHLARRIRLTSSNVRCVPKKPTTDCTRAAQSLINPSFTGNAATRHGRTFEPVARAAFASQTALTVTPSGTVVCSDHPWLSASPDGLLEDIDALLEIKCPHLDNVWDLMPTKNYDIQTINGELRLSPTGVNGYYSQVQFAMFCCKKNNAFLYLWSAKGKINVIVPYDQQYVEDNFPRLRKFYFTEMLPRVQVMHKQGKFHVTRQYARLSAM